jgi:hypothetical protein
MPSIDFSGSQSQFCYSLIYSLVDCEQPKDGPNPVEAVLETIKEFVGMEDREYCDTLIQELRIYQSKQELDKVSTRNEIFISYSHKDTRFLERLQIHLKPIERLGAITRWDDTLIKPGEKWRDSIRLALERAKVAVLLISADFLASDFITTNELPPLLAAAESEGAVILPVIVSPSRFQHIESLSQFQAVNSPWRPLTRMTRGAQEEVFVKITEVIENALQRKAP